jgi:hypothetical protein
MGYITFTPMKISIYNYETEKPWNEIKGKNIMWKTKREYAVLENIEDSSSFSYITNSRDLKEVIERYQNENKDKDLWNPWNWKYSYISKTIDTLKAEDVKKLYDMWDDLWEYIEEKEKNKIEELKEEKKREKERNELARENYFNFCKINKYDFEKNKRKHLILESEEELNNELEEELNNDSEDEEIDPFKLDKIIYKEVKGVLKNIIENNYMLNIETNCY